MIRLITVALFARGHVLLEGGVGVGKTTVLRAFARVVGGEFERVEGTIDLMPSDLVYHTYVDAEGRPRIDPGPLLRHGERLTTFFFNEINRARPQVQSLLLRAMAERSVWAFVREYRFPHMTVFADRNKVEKEETFELASAARDRFLFELGMPTPDDVAVRRALVFDADYHDVDRLLARLSQAIVPWEQLNQIGAAIQHSAQSSKTIERYVLDIWQATETPQRFGIALDGVDMERLILAGASPRGARGGVARGPRASDSRGHSRGTPARARPSRVLHADLRIAAPGTGRGADCANRRQTRRALSHERHCGVSLPFADARVRGSPRLASRRELWLRPGIRDARAPLRLSGSAPARSAGECARGAFGMARARASAARRRAGAGAGRCVRVDTLRHASDEACGGGGLRRGIGL
ncbi:MAG: MoxR-like ATPases [uncultured Paraburkholderia sp.]|nr:MAG: MoxR-like ATPases [uncultured Paraburkholderia sp.]